ncbi:hypothetical protein HMPREF3190_00579 [Umbribacter vaginalis]|nr:hypothetical protein HMPREF3190_00579 [Coriobacteriales bacterium DNF00809]
MVRAVYLHCVVFVYVPYEEALIAIVAKRKYLTKAMTPPYAGNYCYRCKTEALVCVLRTHARHGYRKV